MSKQVKLYQFLKRKPVNDDESCKAGPSTVEGVSSEKLVANGKKCRKAANRKYNSDYIKYGFTYIVKDADVQLPQCVICAEILSNGAMKPAKLLRHFESKHEDYVGRSIDFFRRKESELKSKKKIMETFSNHNKASLKASYIISLRIVQAKKPFTIGEDLILPCILDATHEILGAKFSQKMTSIPLSNNTVTRRIEVMSSDVENQLITKVKQSKWFSLQVDESTDITNKAILLVYVKYIDFEKLRACEEFMTCLEIRGHTTGDEIFKVLNGYIQEHNLSWTNCVGLCTDDAAAMTGRKSGLVSLVKKEAGEDIEITHCIIHREMLVAKRMNPEIHDILTSAVKIVNFIKSRSLNSRLFSILCEEMGSTHTKLLLHTEVRWLSRGRVLNRLYELREEVFTFLINNKSDFADNFKDQQWLAKLAFLSDIFQIINELNLSLQGPSKTIFDFGNRIDSFKKKLKLWERKVQEDRFDMFPLFSEFVSSTENFNTRNMFLCINNYIQALQQNFEDYFPVSFDSRSGNLWIIDPFLLDENCKLSLSEQEQLIELSSDLHLKTLKSNSINVITFWIQIREEYPILSEKALKVLLPFHSTYLCETAFSALSAIKTKYRNRLQVGPALRLSLTAIKPDIEKLVSEMQAQCSH